MLLLQYAGVNATGVLWGMGEVYTGVLSTRHGYVIYGATWTVDSDVVGGSGGDGEGRQLRAQPPTYLRFTFHVAST